MNSKHLVIFILSMIMFENKTQMCNITQKYDYSIKRPFIISRRILLILKYFLKKLLNNREM